MTFKIDVSLLRRLHPLEFCGANVMAACWWVAQAYAPTRH